MSKIIGLTGGIGSGKSTVAAYFAGQGIPIYTADDEAKSILYSNKVSASVKSAFGETVLTNGIIDRKKLSAKVFQNPDELAKLNSIIHPAVIQNFKEWVGRNSAYPILIKEAAILFESGSDADCDAVITVSAPVKMRIERVMNRDGVSRQEVQQRMNNQWTDEQRTAKSDYVIINTDFNNTLLQAAEILKKLQKM